MSMNICIFIDPTLDSFQYFIKNVIKSVGMVPLNPSQDSIKQVADYLKRKREIREVHIISHGSPGCLNLGETKLHLDNIENYSLLLKQSFSAVDSLILYGCHLAKGTTGQNFIKKLHKITGAKIAASNSLTGNNLLGGNWEFEFKIGNFNVNLPFPETALQTYPSVLATFTVNSTGDLDDGNIGNGITTLREAINAANTNPGEDRIEFNISNLDPGFNPAGFWTIQPASILPEITDDSLFIDGKSQPGFSDSPIIELDFSIVDSAGLGITSNNNTIQGLVLNGSRFAAINFRDGGNNLIQDNFIGTDVTGTVAARNDGFGGGILILDSPNNIIQNNLISSNSAPGIGGPNIGISGGLANENQIIGNLIGTDITGTVALENNGTWSIIITEASNNIIGGTTEAERNVIGVSSNGFGIVIGLATATIIPPLTDGVASGNRILGNYIGTDITGKVALGTQDSVGIFLTEDPGFGVGNTINIIGGTTPEERNVISGHGAGIIILDDTRNAYQVIGNYIGTDESGTIAIGNGTEIQGGGVLIAGSNSSIGGTGLGEGNLISGNAIGIQIVGDPLNPDDVSNNQIIGNLIGTQADGITPLGNTKQGILVEAVNNNNNNIIGGTEVGAGNIIAFNSLNGIEIADSNGVEIRQNEIFSNGNLGIDLIATANNSQAEPALNSALIINDITTVTGTLNSTPNAEFTLEFFSNTVLDPSLNGEGERFILSTVVTTDGVGNANFNIELPTGITVNEFITATATNNIDKNTSEFSEGVEVIDPLIVTNTTDSGIGSLREAINFANTIPGENTISFNIPQTDPGFNIDTNSFTIQPGSKLPEITEAVILDATTQPGYTETPVIEIDGTNAAGLDDGVLEIVGGESSTIRGFVINQAGFSNAAILISNSVGNRIENNYLGTEITGTVDPGDNGSGIIILNSANNVIQDNLISGNNNTSATGIRIAGNTATNNQILGNLIGTNVTGTASLANSNGGIVIENAPNNIIGGTTPNERNIISGNGFQGINITGIDAAGNQIYGNYIGSDITGTVAIPNSFNGILISSNASNTIIGGTGEGEGNLISGNSSSGVYLQTGTNNQVIGNIVGTDISGKNALENGGLAGVRIETSDNTIADNLVSGNTSDGILISGNNANNNTVIGNLVGTDIDGIETLGNGEAGIVIAQTATNNKIGGTTPEERNIISGNNSSGVSLQFNATNNQVLGNYIGTNINGTVDLGNDADGISLLAAPNNTIGGTIAGSGNVISGNNGNGIDLGLDSSETQIFGNFIGTDASGTVAIPNDRDGISTDAFPANTIIGGTNPTQRNLISGNGGNGIYIDAPNTQIIGNFIGTQIDGISSLGNTGIGIDIAFGGVNTRIGGTNTGEGNTIAFNSRDGVFIGNGSTGNAILSNSIFSNGELGIDLNAPFINDAGTTANDEGDADTGSNNLQNFPVITSAISDGTNLTISGTLNSTPNTTFRVEFFLNNTLDSTTFGEGEQFLGFANLTTDESGNVSFEEIFSSNFIENQFITATATDPNNNTSEFSGGIEVNPLTTVEFSQESYQLNEDGTVVGSVITINRTGNTVNSSSIEIQLTDGTAKGGTSFSPEIDYNNSTILLNFASGETFKTLTLPLNDDPLVEDNETLTLTLINGSLGTIINPQNTAIVEIIDNDEPVPTPTPGEPTPTPTPTEPTPTPIPTEPTPTPIPTEPTPTPIPTEPTPTPIPTEPTPTPIPAEPTPTPIPTEPTPTPIPTEPTPTPIPTEPTPTPIPTEPTPTPIPTEPTPTPTPTEPTPTPTPTEPTPTPTPTEPTPTREPENPDCLCPSFPNLPNIRLTEPTNTISGNEQNEALLGTEENDFLEGLGGNDSLTGFEGNDTLVGGIENDILFGNKNSDLLLGETGEDTLYGGKEDDIILGNEGNDLMFGDEENDSLLGGEGNDTLLGGVNPSSDLSQDGQDLLFGNEGNDLILGNKDNDSLSGGEGDDTLYGGKNNDLIFGDLGRDLLFGDQGNDTLCGGEENDTLYGSFSSQTEPRSGDEEDFLCGDQGNDILFGKEGNDTLNGGSEHDLLYGGTNNDSIVGGAGDDTLFGEEGDNILAGGTGNDLFVIFVNAGKNTLLDFQDNQDKILVSSNENLANSIAFEELLITQDGNNTLIKFQDKVLVTLEEIDATVLTSEDFFFVNG